MPIDHSKTNYYEVESLKGSGNEWRFKVYHYDPSGNKEITIYASDWHYDSEDDAVDAADEWMDENGVEAEPG